MNRVTGQAISRIEHIRQSIGDILSTPLGSRIQRRDYGSQLPDLIDAPGNATTILLCYAAATTALMRWEPRIRISRVGLGSLTADGTAVFTLEGTLVDTNEPLNLSVPLKLGATV